MYTTRLPVHFFLYCVLLVAVFAAGASYVRFVVLQEYVVSYESACDAASASCFIGCEDEECTETYHYKLMKKHARELYAQCGEDITDCAAADECGPEDNGRCSVTYCDSTSTLYECETVTLDGKDELMDEDEREVDGQATPLFDAEHTNDV